MVIYLSGDTAEDQRLDEMTPRQIVGELDKHVVGQRNAKRAVAIALRNRVRRQKLAPATIKASFFPFSTSMHSTSLLHN